MGYLTRTLGEITFAPPLTHAETTAWIVGRDDLFAFDINATETETPDGRLIAYSADRITCRYQNPAKAYNARRDLQAICDHVKGRTFSGCILLLGEESGDVRRLVVDSRGEVHEEKALLTWPDGSAVIL